MDSRNIVVRNLFRNSSPEFEIKAFEPEDFDPTKNEAENIRAKAAKERKDRAISTISRLTGASAEDIKRAELAGINARNTEALVNRAVNQSTASVLGAFPEPLSLSLPSEDALRQTATDFLDEYLEDRRRETDFD